MRIRHYLYLAVLLGLPPAHAGDLPIGTVPLSLGLDQSTVMKALHARFHVVAVVGNSNMFFVSESKSPNASILGGVSFENGRLAWIQRNWGNFSGTINPIEVTKALFSAIESAKAASATASAVVSTTVQRIPGAEFKSIHFVFPGRKITISTTDGDAKYGQQASIDESVSVKP